MTMGIRMAVLGRLCTYEPQPDITVYELALLHRLVAIATSTPTEQKERNAYIVAHGLQRHWVPVPQEGENEI